MKFLLTLFLVCSLGALASSMATGPVKARLDNFHVYDVFVEDEAQLKLFKQLTNDIEIAYMEEIGGVNRNYQFVVDPANQKRAEQLMTFLKFDWNVIIKNMQDALEQAKYNSTSKMDWVTYHSLEEIYDWVDRQCLRNFAWVKCELIGYSYEGRPIRAMHLSKRKGNKAIVIESNIHALEWITSATNLYFINEMLNSNDKILNELSWQYDWIFIPMMNPDGFVYTHTVHPLWRKNRRPTGVTNSSGICYGTDLNRNYGYHWGGAGYNIDVACDHWYGGSEAETEPEVQAMERYMSNQPDNYIRMYLALHSYGQYVLLPYGHSTEVFPPNYDQMMRIASAFADAAEKPYGTTFTYGASGLLNYVVSGAMKDWAYGVKNVPFTATIELRDKGKYGFFLPAKQIIEVGKEVTLGLKALVAKGQEEGIFN